MTTPIDLRTAGPGWEVEFRCGGKATVLSVIESSKIGVRLDFNHVAADCFWWDFNGSLGTFALHPFDIVALHRPPLTPEERLALTEQLLLARDKQLAEIARKLRNDPGSAKLLDEILALAEGRES